MPKKSLVGLTESMFYVLMAFYLGGEKCGTDVAEFIEDRSGGRIRIGPATLYTVLAKFEQEKCIQETAVEGRKRSYRITARGIALYREELERLRRCLADAERGGEISV